MAHSPITIPVKLSEKSFRRFALYDAFVLNRKWIRPASFAGILTGFAVIALLSRRQQSGLIAAVLLVIALGLPLVWAGTFLTQVNLQVQRFRLKPPRLVYTVTLTEESMHVQHAGKSKETVDIALKDLWTVRQCRGDMYLYASPGRAFILPSGQADAADAEILELLSDKVHASR